MKQLRFLLLSSVFALSACGQAGEQWMNPDTTFSLFDQPEVKGVDETQADMAKEASDAGEFGRAAQIYEQIIARGKAPPEKMFGYKLAMADAVRKLGDAQACLAMYEELAKEKPEDLDVKEGRALAMMGGGKIEDAGRLFSEIMEKDAKRWRTLNAIGILFVTKNMIPEAIQYYTEALEHSPENPAVLNNVGLSYAIDRNFTRAVAALEQAARVSKTTLQRKQVEMNLAMIHGVSGNMEHAREVAGKYFEGPALDNNLGLYAHLAKDSNLAKAYLNMALSQSPTYYERAWENLEAVASDPRRPDPFKPSSKPTKKPLPELDAAADPKKKAKKEKTGSKAEAKEPPAAAPTKGLPKLPKPSSASVVDKSTKPLPKLDGSAVEEKKSAVPPKVEPAKPVESEVKEKKEEVLPAAEKKEAVSEAKPEEKKSEEPKKEAPEEKAAAESKKSDKPAEEKPPELIVGPSEGD